MGKKFYSVIASLFIIACVSLLGSCSSDNNEPENPAQSYLSGNYTPGGKSYVLAATVNDEVVGNDAEASLKSADYKTATIVMKNIVGGTGSVTLANVALRQSSTNTLQYDFAGDTKLADGKTLTYAGNVTMTGYSINVLTIALTTK